MKLDVISSALDGQSLCLTTDEGDADPVLRIYNLEGEVTVDVGGAIGNNTVGRINLYHIGSYDRSLFVGHSARNDVACVLSLCSEGCQTSHRGGRPKSAAPRVVFLI